MTEHRDFDGVLQGSHQGQENVKVKLGQNHRSFLYNSKCRQHSLATESFLSFMIHAVTLYYRATLPMYTHQRKAGMQISLTSPAATEENDGKH